MVYMYHPHTGRFEQSARSTLRASTVGPFGGRGHRASTVGPYVGGGYHVSRRSYDDDILYSPSRMYHRPYDTTGNEYATHGQINRELIMSTSAMEDNYDITNKSRARDRDVLAAANRAIPTGGPSNSTERAQSSMGRQCRSAARSFRSAPRSQSVPQKRPTYTANTTTTVLPSSSMKASSPPKPSQYLNHSKHLELNKSLRNSQYEPMYSNQVRTSYSPLRALSPYRSESPYRSDSPFRSESPYRADSPYRSQSPLETEPTSSTIKRRKPPRVLASKRRVGNYYNRLLTRRGSGGRAGKYWPYLDVEDIESENVADLFGNNGDAGESSDYLCETSHSPSYNYVIDTGDGSRSYTVEPLSLGYGNEDTDIPDEYVPFKPRYKERSPDRDYSQMSVLPYIPKRDPAKNSLQDDLNFNALVTQSASRARKALENIKWENYDSAGLVLSVEGEYTHPEQNTALGFRYVSRPIMLKVPAAQRVSYKDSDNSFTKYMTDLRKFRDEVRNRLEEGYSTLNKYSTTHYEKPAIDYTSSPSYTPSYTRPTRSYRRYVTSGDDESPIGHSLELYPVTSRSSSRTRALLDSDDLVSSSRSALKSYDGKHDKDSKSGTLARIEVKAALLGSKVEALMPERKRRPKSSYAQARVRNMERDRRVSGEPEAPVFVGETTSLKAHRPVSL